MNKRRNKKEKKTRIAFVGYLVEMMKMTAQAADRSLDSNVPAPKNSDIRDYIHAARELLREIDAAIIEYEDDDE